MRPTESFADILAAHLAAYPLMRPEDAYKLAYQSEFGGGHMVTDEQESLLRIERELLDAPDAPAQPEPIGGGLCRVYLGSLKHTRLRAATLNRLFILTAGRARGARRGLEAKLRIIRAAAARGEAGFSAAELDEYLEKQERTGYPAAGHSARYRAAYRPAYRVVARGFCNFLAVFALADSLLERRTGPVVLAVDGNCCAGKSSLAAMLQSVYSCNVIHMDDFFLRPSQRTPERFQTPGANVDHERFLSEVGARLRTGAPFAYRRYDCGAQRLSPPVRVVPSRLTVVEGSYSMHPSLQSLYDAAVFLAVSPQAQLDRLRARESAGMLDRFIHEWIPLEQAYFDAYRIRETCALAIDTSCFS